MKLQAMSYDPFRDQIVATWDDGSEERLLSYKNELLLRKWHETHDEWRKRVEPELAMRRST